MNFVYDYTHRVDPPFYCDLYPDLKNLTPAEARQHYIDFGRAEGRIANFGNVREYFLRSIPKDLPILEIGPFTNPAVRGPAVSYADIFSKNELLKNAKAHGLDPNGCPDIQYVLSEVPLSKIQEKFQNVLSCHCIEHQTDLIGHLRDVAELLEPGGSYYLIIPDKRYCFDYFIPESTIADVMAAHAERRTTHTLRAFVAGAAMTTHNDVARHWEGDHGTPNYVADPAVFDRAIHQHQEAGAQYLDCHGWQFSPMAFGQICQIAFDMSLTGLRPIAVFDTLKFRAEFCAILTRTV